MQQLISIPPSKHTGARVVAASTALRNVCASCCFGQLKDRKYHNGGKTWPIREWWMTLICQQPFQIQFLKYGMSVRVWEWHESSNVQYTVKENLPPSRIGPFRLYVSFQTTHIAQLCIGCISTWSTMCQSCFKLGCVASKRVRVSC